MFGKGFTYCIGLFLAHQHMFENKEEYSGLWFNGASDHLYELEVPDNFILKEECLAWQKKVLNYGHGMEYLCTDKVKQEEVSWALDKAREFLMAWDKQCGIEVIKSEYH